MSESKTGRAPWAGRFRAETDRRVGRYTRSLHLDRRLAFFDLEGSRAHVRMLARQGIIPAEDRDRILEGLDRIEEEIRSDTFPYREGLEDIHMNVERRLQELVGDAGGRIHTGRSRNDQVALDLKLFCLDQAASWQRALRLLLRTLVERSQGLKEELFPGWTHGQAAQPLSWAHYLLAFCAMFGRDHRRLESYRELHSVSPLGAGALTGSTLPLDPEWTASELGFQSSFSNSYDVVGDRDFVLELVQIGSQIMLHTSRLAEDFIYFTSTPVGWIELPDALCTGSSMMPQKKNPDVLELARGKTAGVLGHAAALAVLLKGLPTSYHRDLQQDKEHLFSVADTVGDTLEMVLLALARFEPVRPKSRAALGGGFLMATDLAEHLVTRGVPFRQAHQQVGRLVALCVEKGLSFEELPLDEIQQALPACGPEVLDLLRPEGAVRRRSHKGSGGLASIERQIEEWEEWLSHHE